MELTITAARAGKLSSFLKNELKMSTGLVNKVKWADGLRVNGLSCHTNYQVEPGDVIAVRLEEAQPEYPAEQGPLTVLFEDDWLLAVDKPAGMLIHPSRNRITGTLANLVQGYYARTGQQGAFHPLTRLDRDTFGIVLIAKNSHIHALLQQRKPGRPTRLWFSAGRMGKRASLMRPLPERSFPAFCGKFGRTASPASPVTGFWSGGHR